jgi:hypothetical protein
MTNIVTRIIKYGQLVLYIILLLVLSVFSMQSVGTFGLLFLLFFVMIPLTYLLVRVVRDTPKTFIITVTVLNINTLLYAHVSPHKFIPANETLTEALENDIRTAISFDYIKTIEYSSAAVGTCKSEINRLTSESKEGSGNTTKPGCLGLVLSYHFNQNMDQLSFPLYIEEGKGIEVAFIGKITSKEKMEVVQVQLGGKWTNVKAGHCEFKDTFSIKPTIFCEAETTDNQSIKINFTKTRGWVEHIGDFRVPPYQQ